jgi:hypothetical protein
MAMNILDHSGRVWVASRELGDYYRLNDPGKASVLYPIPEGNGSGFSEWREKFRSEPVIGFAGSFHSHQLVQFRNIAQVLSKINGRILIVSKKNDIIKDSLKDLSNIDYHEPFMENKGIINFLKSNASCILIPDSIDPRAAGSGLSFPSRLVEFSHLGLPMIIISPPGTALAKWANRHNWLGYCESIEGSALLERINMLIDKENWEKMAKQSQDAVMGEFNPERIQEQFERELAVA